MSRYDIEPLGVQGVLNRVEVHLRDMDSAIGKLGGALNEAAHASGSGKVAGALSDWSSQRTFTLTATNTAAWNSIEGCGIAVVAYIRGDMQMMRNAQSNAGYGFATTPPTSGPGTHRPGAHGHH